MNSLRPNNIYSRIFNYILISLPVFLISVKVVANLLLLVIVIDGLVTCFKEKINPFTAKEFRTISYLFTGYFAVMFLSIILSSGFGEELKHIFRKIHFFFAPLIAVSIYYHNIDISKFVRSFKYGLISAFIISMALLIFFGSINGMFNSNVFGDLLVIYIFVSISQIFREGIREVAFSIASASFGVALLFLIPSRGSWLLFFLLAVVFIIFTHKNIIDSFKNSKKYYLFALPILSLLILFTYPNLKSTYDHTLDNLSSWEDNKEKYTSSGVRLEMWSSALKAFKDAPWHGYGYRMVNREVAKYADFHPDLIKKFTHLHNEYITNLLSAGYAGLISLLIFILYPLKIFFYGRLESGSYVHSIIGIFVSLGFMGMGLTHIAFGEENLNAIYVFLICYLLPNIMKIELNTNQK